MRAKHSLLAFVNSSIFFITITLLITSAPALAHRLNVFAWSEGSTIHTESTFANGNKAQKSRIDAVIDNDSVIASGETDTNGNWSFTIPQTLVASPKEITVRLQAGEGHAATWKVLPSDYQTGASSSAAHTHDAPAAIAPAVTSLSHSGMANSAAALTEEQLTAILNTVLEHKLTPIRKELAAQRQHAPSLQDIFGGIGYIIGLLGLATYMANRKKRQ